VSSKQLDLRLKGIILSVVKNISGTSYRRSILNHLRLQERFFLRLFSNRIMCGSATAF
jgi:hypothetical protein